MRHGFFVMCLYPRHCSSHRQGISVGANRHSLPPKTRQSRHSILALVSRALVNGAQQRVGGMTQHSHSRAGDETRGQET